MVEEQFSDNDEATIGQQLSTYDHDRDRQSQLQNSMPDAATDAGNQDEEVAADMTEAVPSVDNLYREESRVEEELWCGNKLCGAFVGFLFPRLTPIPWSSFFLLSVFVAIPATAYLMLFTKMGYGISTYYYLSENYEKYAGYLGFSIALGAFLLYLFDCFYWSSHTGIWLRRTFITLLIVGIGFFTLFTSGQYPYGPVALFVVLVALWLIMIGKVVYKDIAPKVYVSWLSGPLFFVSLVVFLSWFIWTFLREENEYNLIVSLAEAEKSGCEPNFADYPDLNCGDGMGGVCFTADIESGSLTFADGCDQMCTQVYSQCYNTFIIWVGPFLVSLGLLFLSFFATFLRPGSSPDQETTKLAKIWMFLLFGTWVSASLAGAGAGVSATLTALTLASFIAAAIFLAISYERIERKEHLKKIGDQLVEKYGNHFNVFRGLLIVTCTPVFLLYFFVSFVIQRIRDLPFCPYTKPPVTTMSLRHVGGSGWLTIEARRLLREFQTWDRTKVFTYAIYWGLAFMVLSVIVSQFTLVFLSWLIEKTSVMSLGAVTGILVAIGLTMFLLPPVPGAPIYLVIGIVIIPVGKPIMGIFGSLLFAHGISLALKLVACTLQQKMIGGLLQHYVSVRQFCGVNSNLMRSMKLVLQQPGLGLDKVSILVGGPDWPTSVLCGIMDLELIPILIGTLPIIFLIIPTLLTGSFTYMANVRLDNGQSEFPWAGTVATICAAITAIVQFGSMVLAAYFLEDAVSTRKSELEAIPIDEEVKAADERDEAIVHAYEEVTQWGSLPTLAKSCLTMSLISMIASCYMVQLFADQCFREYQLTYTIEQHLDGDWKNIVKPLGIVANILFLFSLILLYLYRSWAMRKATSKSNHD
mmetsp:Transcript_16023/g.30228  ORF Transcript_16023/g.30228 Transcript_16023/m.30228 type:complete len:866 (-) Transcript_16023:328-2925(-)|eukprot:CAMPEP_0176485542 /NCGR_PEP_ID=MMETSP0200_2-20121128/5092_1 /TAXON_ID=947934 /ORGANISM="Chaetoceros sp., Strain GSL56" /LENGTH=865 /DNA_ID=CAMNT_0017882187 /DNA_START=289 /DNA_END=2886 /DNA_ORIENTATION=+